MARPNRPNRPGGTSGIQDNQVAMNMMLDFSRFEPFDSQKSHHEAVQLDSQLADACQNGDLEAVKVVIQEIRDSKDPIINRLSAWQWRNVSREFVEKAYENNHWHIIEYLAHQPEIETMPPTSNMGNWNLPEAVTQRAVITNNFTELESLLKLGWDINQCHGHMGSYWPSSTPPVIRLLVERGGEVAGTDLIAQAALGDSWGKLDRIAITKYLLEQGASINAMAGSTWKAQRHFGEQLEQFGKDYYMLTYGGGQQALHIAQQSGNKKLVELLLANGADQSIKPLREEPILESGNNHT